MCTPLHHCTIGGRQKQGQLLTLGIKGVCVCVCSYVLCWFNVCVLRCRPNVFLNESIHTRETSTRWSLLCRRTHEMDRLAMQKLTLNQNSSLTCGKECGQQNKTITTLSFNTIVTTFMYSDIRWSDWPTDRCAAYLVASNTMRHDADTPAASLLHRTKNGQAIARCVIIIII